MTWRATSLPNGNSLIVSSDSFDGVTALAVPAGWVATNAQGAAPLSVLSETAPNDALIDDPAALHLPESSIGDGNVTDSAAGDSFVTGDYVAISSPGTSAQAPPLREYSIATPSQPSPPPSPTPTPTPCSSSNGGLLPRATSESGVAAPSPGFFWSEVQHNTGNTTQANTNAGFNDTQGGGFRLADDFTISQTCTINNVVFYGYLTGAPATPSPFTAYTLQIWNGRPGDPGAVVVFGDTTTNRLASSTDSTFFRIFNTVVPPPGTVQGTTRKIWRNTVNVGGITLPPGTYWVDWASTVTGAANHFAPAKTIAGARGAAGDNARQFATGAWVDVTDVGSPAGGTPVPQDFPFEVNGTPSTVTPTPSPTVTPSVTPTVTPSATPTPTPPPPVITSPLDVTGTVGLPFTYQFEATGATSLAVSNLPPGLGLVFNSTLRAIVGNPITSGAFPVILSATNSGGTTNRTLNVTVQSLPPSGPIIVSPTAATGRTGRAFSFQLQATRGSSATRFTVDSLPPGLNLDSFTGFISGTPTSDGSFRLLVSAIDGTAIAQATLQLTFTSNLAVPVITSPATVVIAPGQFFTYSITADANGTFGYIGNDGIVRQSPSCTGLPAGLCFDGDHTISGIFNPPFGSDRGSATQPDQTGGIITSVELIASNPANGTSLLPFFPLRAVTGAENIATRLAVGTGENVLIGGFIIEGNAPKKVVIRARGPSLTQFGVPNALADPVLDLNEGAVLLSSSDNWRDNQGQATQILATALQPSDDREPAILAYLNPGLYTAVERGKNNSTGNALVEVYDLGTVLRADTSNSRLANIATRGTVLGGDSVMIGGVIIKQVDTRMVVRAIGPSLTAFGISGALQDPTLELKNANGATLIGSDDWQDNPTQAAEIQQRMLAPTNPRESALVTTLQPGPYTAIVSGKGGATGVAVVEGYALSDP